jgi:hypothetical protein
MDAPGFERFLDQLASLSKRQRGRVLQLLRPMAGLGRVADVIE